MSANIGKSNVNKKYKLESNSDKDIDISLTLEYSKQSESPIEKYGYDEELNIYRSKIDNIEGEIWKKVRWYINKYDFQVKDPIINRAFYKYWEIINEFDIFEEYVNRELILHCAEAPGGFIQGTNIYLQIDRFVDEVKKKDENKNKIDEEGFTFVKRKKTTKKDYIIYSISLNKDLPQYKMYNLPTYNKNILNKYIYITYGKDNTGDINNIENVKHIERMTNASFYLITADGGFDEGIDFNNKEQLHYSLILNEIGTAIRLQKYDGHFILKMFDIFTETSIHLLYLLNLCYKNVHIYKPKTSRPTNSEKYIICKNFKLDDNKRNEILEKLLLPKLKKNLYMSFRLFDEIPEDFVENIRNINTILVKKQCEYLQYAIELCNNQDFFVEYDLNINDLIEKRKEIFNEWAETYNLEAYV
uniref:Ribosomal RNA methyltransferase FtsJ domain-containing protein n=1 Tax=viral metagenome TaxID=1070528 RepID=A0A6C0DWB5_9ZZZZ